MRRRSETARRSHTPRRRAFPCGQYARRTYIILCFKLIPLKVLRIV